MYLNWKCHLLFLCSALSLRVWCPMFGDNIVVSSLTVRNSTLEDETTSFPLNFGHQTPTDTAQDPRRTKTSFNLRESLKTTIVIPYVVRRVLCATSDLTLPELQKRNPKRCVQNRLPSETAYFFTPDSLDTRSKCVICFVPGLRRR